MQHILCTLFLKYAKMKTRGKKTSPGSEIKTSVEAKNVNLLRKLLQTPGIKRKIVSVETFFLNF